MREAAQALGATTQELVAAGQAFDAAPPGSQAEADAGNHLGDLLLKEQQRLGVMTGKAPACTG